MPNGEKAAHGDGKEDNEGRERKIRHKTPTSKPAPMPTFRWKLEVAEVDEGEDKVGCRNDDNESNNDNTQGGKLRVKDV